jgi:hypothetical protein
MQTAFVKVPVILALRPFIDEAIHSVIENAVLQAGLSNGALFRCADYAIVGARVLVKLTGHSYLAVAGKAIMHCGAGRFVVLSPTRTTRRQAATLSQVVGYHCWIQSLHPVGGGSPRLEMIDFTVRHDWATAKALGVPFTRRTDQCYLWDWSDALGQAPPELRTRLGAGSGAFGWMRKDAHCTRLLRKYEREYDAAFERLTALAVARICDNLEVAVSANDRH